MNHHIINEDGGIQSFADVYATPLRTQDIRDLSRKVSGPLEYVAVLYNGKRATLVVNETAASTDDTVNPDGVRQPNARATAIYWTATIQGRTGQPFAPLQAGMIHGVAVLIEVDRRAL